jgi:polar amino acid transport system permease protein
MNYEFDFSSALLRLPYLIEGAGLTLLIAFSAFAIGAVIGVFGAVGKIYGGPGQRRLINGYVTFVTNTPALVQVFFLFYGLPAVGVVLSPLTAVMIGLALNSGAYLTEIIRGGIAAVRRQELEAASALGLSRAQTVRHVMLPHVLQTVYGPLTNFFVMLVLGSSMAALFGVEELTGRALNVSTANLRTIETFSVVALMYVLMTVVASLALAAVGRYVFKLRLKWLA